MNCGFSHPLNKIRWSYKNLSDSIALVDLEFFLKGFIRTERHTAKELFAVYKSFTTLILKLSARKKHGIWR